MGQAESPIRDHPYGVIATLKGPLAPPGLCSLDARPPVSKPEATAAPKRFPGVTGAFCSAREHWNKSDCTPQRSLCPAVPVQNIAGVTCWGDRTRKRLDTETQQGCIHGNPNAPRQNNKCRSPGGWKQLSPEPAHKLTFGVRCARLTFPMALLCAEPILYN